METIQKNDSRKNKKIRNRIYIGNKVFDIALIIFMCLLMLVIIYPFMNIVAISLSVPSAITTGRVGWLPVGFNTKGYGVVFGDPKIWQAYLNTVLYAAVGTVLNVVITSMIAYPLMIQEFIFKKPLTVLFTITMFFSGGMVPSYILIQNLHLMNTMWSIVLPSCVSAFNIFIYRAFFKGISPEIREAAYVDGASDIRILFRIYMPLSKALFATFGLFAIVGYWNMWFEPLLYLKDTARQPIQLILRQILFTSKTEGLNGVTEMVNMKMINPKNVQYACIIATIGPVLMIYPFIQKYFDKGMMVGAIKG